MKGVAVFALVVFLWFSQRTLSVDIPKPDFKEVRACLTDLARIHNENKNADGEELVAEALYENLFRAMACLEVLHGLENQEITASLENEIHDWHSAIEAAK